MKNKVVITGLILIGVIIFYVNIVDKGDKMTGYIENINEDERSITINITESVKGNRKKDTAEAYIFVAKITDETIIRSEDGKSLNFKDINIGRKVVVKPISIEKYKGTAKEIIILK